MDESLTFLGISLSYQGRQVFTEEISRKGLIISFFRLSNQKIGQDYKYCII